MKKTFMCGEVTERLKEIKDESVDLVVTDPPYNIGWKYAKGIHGVVDDRREDYDTWVAEWVEECFRVLKPEGSLYIIAYHETLSDYYWEPCMKHGHFRRWLTWPYKMNYGHTLKNYVKAQRGILYFTKHKLKYTFNGEAILIPYPESSLKQKHVKEAIKKHGRAGRPSYDWFSGINVVQHTHPEKQKFRTPDGIDSMNQIPEALTDIFIKASSNEGDVVLDPFCGTGSTAVSALRLGREIITIDQSASYLQVALKRIKECLSGD